jgi:hypothetical protein
MKTTPIVRALALAGLCCASLTPALADPASDRIDALEKRLAASARVIEQLASRVVELEKSGKPTAAQAAAPATAKSQAEAIASLQDNVSQLAAGMSQRGNDTGVPLHGFADVGAMWSSGDDPVELRGFHGGTLDIYLTPTFGERTKGLVELAVEYGPDGKAALDMERLQIGYTVSDGLTVWAGRFHTPFGLWNTSFHHGANLQTSITRPRFVDFEDKGGIIPAHSVGLWASGKARLDGSRLTYDAYVANGPSIGGRTLDYRANTDNSAGKMLGGNLGWQPGSVAGLSLGVHAFGSTVDAQDGNGAVLSSTRVRMVGAYAGYDEGDWEVIAETYHFGNEDAGGGGTRSSNAWFGQVGRTFGNLTPFVRLEQVALDSTDKYFISQESGRSYRRTAVGLRYALDPKVSLKFELSSTREDATSLIDEAGGLMPFTARSYQRAGFQYSVAF